MNEEGAGAGEIAAEEEEEPSFAETVRGTYAARVVLPPEYLQHWVSQFRPEDVAVVGHRVFRELVMPLHKRALDQSKQRAVEFKAEKAQRVLPTTICGAKFDRHVEDEFTTGMGNGSFARISQPAGDSREMAEMQRLFPHRSIRFVLVVCRLSGNASFSALISAQSNSIEWLSVVDGLFYEETEDSGVKKSLNRFYFQEVVQWLGLFLLSRRCVLKEALSPAFISGADPRHCTHIAMFWTTLRLLERRSVLNAQLACMASALDAFIENFVE